METMMLVPEGYDKGIAAFSTTTAANAFAKELDGQTGFQHRVVVDNRAGCAVVECTGKAIGGSSKGTTLEGYEKSYACLRDTLRSEGALTPQERDVLTHENPLDVDISTWNAVYCKTVFPGKDETMFDFQVAVRRTIDKESEKFGRKLNAFLLKREKEGKHDENDCFLLIMFPSAIADIKGDPFTEGDILYTQHNEEVAVNDIKLEPLCNFESPLCDRSNFYIALANSERLSPCAFGNGVIRLCWYWTGELQTDSSIVKHYNHGGFKKTLWSDDDRRELCGIKKSAYKPSYKALCALGALFKRLPDKLA